MFGLSYLLTLMNCAAINTCVKVLSEQMCFFAPLGSMPMSEIFGLYGNSIFNFLQSCQTILHSPWQCRWLLLFPTLDSIYCCCFSYSSLLEWSNISLWVWFAFSQWLIAWGNFSCASWSFTYLPLTNGVFFKFFTCYVIRLFIIFCFRFTCIYWFF